MTAFTTLPFCTCPSGEASLTLAVMTSPSPARRPVAPPSGRIIWSLRAPELSATSSMVLIITAMFVSPSFRLAAGFGLHNFWNQRRLPQNLFQFPPLQPRQWPRLCNAHEISDVRRVLLVVRVELFADGDHPAVEGRSEER